MQNFIIKKFKQWSLPFSRFAIFIVYFWFGALKVFAESPANPLVDALLKQTLPGVTFAQFIVFFGVFEMLIGILFLLPRFTRLVMFLLLIHLTTTLMPLFVLPSATWQGFLVPTLEGQYIIKNILIISAAMGIFAHTHILNKGR
ncbi:MAG: hypothetical protein M3P22_01025 [bacterium]|nr:hypothetical protein [bacterium]